MEQEGKQKDSEGEIRGKRTWNAIRLDLQAREIGRKGGNLIRACLAVTPPGSKKKENR